MATVAMALPLRGSGSRQRGELHKRASRPGPGIRRPGSAETAISRWTGPVMAHRTGAERAGAAGRQPSLRA